MNRRIIINAVSQAVAVLLATASLSAQPAVKHSRLGESVKSKNGDLTITCFDKRQSFSSAAKDTYDDAINSPKSVNFHPDGSRFYVNSLEGCRTVVYDAHTAKRLKTIEHRFTSGTGALWAQPSQLYEFTHYDNGRSRAFDGKPVESCFSHGGRYLWVPYYRRTFDINAQDPSAVAVIDTRTDTIVRMFDCGPLPKMIACSHDNRTIAVTHWGNNTVGLIDISSPDIKQWHHRACVVVERLFPLNFSLTSTVNRDTNSGLTLRGTVFTPDDRFILVGMMSGNAIGVIDAPRGEYIGKITGSGNVRHLIIKDKWLYGSNCSAGIVRRVELDKVVKAIESCQGAVINVPGWQTCQVGAGARTIEASPSGRWIFAACNSVSQLYVVDATDMSVAASIDVDSYPVGLDISTDGTLVAVTSQGIKGSGGNAVNLYRIEYADSTEARAAMAAQAQREKNEKAENGESINDNTGKLPGKNRLMSLINSHPQLAIVAAAAVLALLAAAITAMLVRRRRRKTRH